MRAKGSPFLSAPSGCPDCLSSPTGWSWGSKFGNVSSNPWSIRPITWKHQMCHPLAHFTLSRAGIHTPLTRNEVLASRLMLQLSFATACSPSPDSRNGRSSMRIAPAFHKTPARMGLCNFGIEAEGQNLRLARRWRNIRTDTA